MLHRNLERSLRHHGEERPVFLDQVDLGTGHSWVSQLQAGVSDADRFVLVAAPESMASPRVSDEYESFVAGRRDWCAGNLQVVLLVDAPLPTFFEPVQQCDFREYDEKRYCRSLRELVAGLLGHEDRRKLPELPADVEVPKPPEVALSVELRKRLVAWLAPFMARRLFRRAIANALGLEGVELEGYSSPESAASAALIGAAGDENPVVATLRILRILSEELREEEPNEVKALEPIAAELKKLREKSDQPELLQVWLKQVAADHEKLVPYFQRETELELLERVYVELELRTEGAALAEKETGHLRPGALGLRELLRITPEELPWISQRWIVRGDPGSGKTTLLRHLTATLAREEEPEWLPVFESLPRLMREPEWLLERIARQLLRAGHPARGLAAVLDGAGHAGRLLLLLDGLDEVPREARKDADRLLRELSTRWPQTPVVVTTRPIGYRRPGGGFREVELLPLDSARRREFLGRWFGRAKGTPDENRAAEVLEHLEAEPSLRELAGNPLYLTLMALLLEQGTSPERNRTRLYDQVFELLLEGKHRPEGKPMPAKKATRGVLRRLGYALTRENRDSEPVAALEERMYQPELDSLRGTLERVPRWRLRSLRPFLDDLAERTGILGPHDGPDADWRFWHRTFREALAAERLEELFLEEGSEAVLAHAGRIAGDESRWAEPYALLTGRIEEPDELVRSLVSENRPLGLRAVATAQGLEDATLREVLELSEDWEERAKVYVQIPELVDDPERALALIERLRRGNSSGNDLYFLDTAAAECGRRWKNSERRTAKVRRRLYDHLAEPPRELFEEVETPHDGRVELWRDISEGSFLMGSPEGTGHNDEHPQHEVSIAAPFQIAAVPVTNRQFAAFDPEHEPRKWEGVAEEEVLDHPVVQVSWYEMVSFCRWLAARAKWAEGARLPSEEEWEYACRAGTVGDYWSGDEKAELERVGWFDGNSDGRTHRVGGKEANPWGLYDVHGNVWEWTLSAWSDDYTGRKDGVEVDPGAVEVPAETPGGASRVIRGGSYADVARFARSAYRDWYEPLFRWQYLGFRVLLPSPSSSRDPRS